MPTANELREQAGLRKATPFGVKHGDWVFHDFHLSQVSRVEDGRVTGMCDGFTECGGWNITSIRPLSFRAKWISEYFESVKKSLHDKASSHINWPDIQQWLVNQWLDCCDATTLEAEKNILTDVEEFLRVALEPQPNTKWGFPLYRPR